MTTFNFDDNTPAAVQDAINRAYHSNARIRIYFGDTDTGRDWMEEYDTIGTIGRTTGTVKKPLLINNARSLGGGCINTSCIVKIVNLSTGNTMYKHATYNIDKLVACESQHSDYCYDVLNTSKNNEVHARFKTVGAYQRWIKFIRGERNTKGGRLALN